MKIDHAWKRVRLDRVCSGSLVYFEGKYYIVTNTSPDCNNKLVYCVNIDTGDLDKLSDCTLVIKVDDACVKIVGGYDED